ncbi:hypothetical protein [Methylobacterium sp. WL6]|uniref:hypothetical protein n=1 Tax=Methylobacterium sp. WL6 TaxID=2603901 RepID=UPI0011C9FB02|nr:hypothetical protein [Methylobacterium sp. WL6]TXN65357.1 hypothetical protein FV230_16975 [Methylobacterium sp. WL6]
MANKRSAEYVSTLVYLDGPQLIKLKAHKTTIVAMAIPCAENESLFIATSVTQKNWVSYLDGHVDLRFLFTFADIRTNYTFDLLKLKKNKITMLPWEGNIGGQYLPEPRFFASNHTEEDIEAEQEETYSETLQVDGEWDMPDFGSFYSRYSDVYYFLSSAGEYEDEETPEDLKNNIRNAFRDKAFKGGFSYVHFFDAISRNRARTTRLAVDKIKYESPGYINVNGEKTAFKTSKDTILGYLSNRKLAREAYKDIYVYLSKARLLKTAGQDFPTNHPQAAFIKAAGYRLANEIGIPNLDGLFQLVEQNALVFTKVIMSFCRRIEEASRFIAQGRVNFT